ncbi:hypothetical protein [Comamonas sp. JC664]|uniref:hypothetical protein n=1 Tax=Comamonas sp. JC664 TaxID=2801917 RepID=UPI00174E5ABD|nr:hypothetical protein [Comamonas sp. JC664]MBL0693160.1 hypothetical protein [Comamonas sp. JC664]GHG97097.1 hypothetical protein GCM10012319_61810 [Comamonas sp. KCTC 72670]
MARSIRKHFASITLGVITLTALTVAGLAHADRKHVNASIDNRVEHAQQPRPDVAPPTPTPRSADCGIREVGEHAYEIPLQRFTEALEQMGDPQTHVRIVPAFRDGKAYGFKLFSLKPGALYAQLGFQSGDVVRNINGIALHTPEQTLQAYDALRGQRRFEVDVERGGHVIRKVYDVK